MKPHQSLERINLPQCEQDFSYFEEIELVQCCCCCSLLESRATTIITIPARRRHISCVLASFEPPKLLLLAHLQWHLQGSPILKPDESDHQASPQQAGWLAGR